MPWARPKARHTRDFEDVIGWLCQRTDRTAATRLMRVSWQAVTAMVERVVGDYLDSDRLDRIYRIGVDEISYKSHHYLTVICFDPFHVMAWVNRALDAVYNEHRNPFDDRRRWQQTRTSLRTAAERRIERNFAGIVASLEYRMSNALAENINARIRLVNKRGYGHHSARTLATMIYLCLGGIVLELPTQT